MSTRSRNTLLFVLVLTSAAVGAVLSAPTAPDTRASIVAPAHEISPQLSMAAFDGGFFAVWREQRRGPWTDVYGARLGIDGGWIGLSVPFPVAAEPLSQEGPQIACGGGVCVVAYWHSGRGPMALRLDEAGRPLDPAPLALAPSLGWGTVAVAFGPTGFMVTWVDGDLLGATLGATGLASAVFTVSSDAALYKSNPSLAAGPGGFLVAWTGFNGGDNLQVQRLSPTGALLGAVETVASASGLTAHVASDGAQWVVSWVNDTTGIYEGPLMARRIQPVAGFFGAAFEMSPGAGAFAPQSSLIFDGTNFVAAANHSVPSNGIELFRVSTLGAPAGRTPVADTTAQQGVPSLAISGGTTAVAFLDELHLVGPELRVVSLNAAGSAIAPPAELPAALHTHRDLRLGAVPGGFVTLWTDDSAAFAGSHYDVSAAISGLDGVSVGPPVPIATGTPFQSALGAGSGWVGWIERPTYFASEVVFASPVSLAGKGPTVPLTNSACCAGELTFVDTGPWVWALFSAYASGLHGFGVRLAPDAGRLDALDHILVSNAPGFTGAWASQAQSMLVVWVDASGVEAQRFDLNGAALDALPRTLATGYLSQPAVASDGTDFLVVWVELYTAVYAQRVDGRTGQALGARLVLRPCCDAPGSDETDFVQPHLAFDGQAWQVVYGRNTTDGGLDLWLSEVSPAGLVTAPRPLVEGPFDDFAPRVAVTSPGRVGVASLAFDPVVQGVRAQLRVLAAVPLGAVCVSTAECVSGQCTSGVCLLDAGVLGPDAGVVVPDGGGGSDAGIPDQDGGSGTDAGVPDQDGGSGFDAGIPDQDAGVTSDGGTSPTHLLVACGCQSGESGLAAFLLLALLTRRRR